MMSKKCQMGWRKFTRRGLFVLGFILFVNQTGMHSSLHAASHQKLSKVLLVMVPKGWEIMEGVKKITPDNLYLQINGRAEFFLSYDMLNMTFASYIKKTDDTQFIDVSVYDMGKPSNAFGVFSSERTSADRSLSLGRAGYRSNSNYFIWKGRYYIRIISSDNTKALRRLGMDLAQGLTDTLTDAGEPVWGLMALPSEHRIPESIQYSLRDAMGLDFMTNTYTANYRFDSEIVTVFLSPKESLDSGKEILKKYADYAKQFGNGSERLAIDGIDLILCDMDGSFDAIFMKGRLIGGVTAVEKRELAVDFARNFWKKLK